MGITLKTAEQVFKKTQEGRYSNDLVFHEFYDLMIP